MTAIVTASLVTTIAIVTVTRSVFHDCVHTETPIVTVTQMVTVTLSKHEFSLTTISVTPRPAHHQS